MTSDALVHGKESFLGFLVRCSNTRLVVVLALLGFPFPIDPRLRILILLLAVAIVKETQSAGAMAWQVRELFRSRRPNVLNLHLFKVVNAERMATARAWQAKGGTSDRPRNHALPCQSLAFACRTVWGSAEHLVSGHVSDPGFAERASELTGTAAEHLGHVGSWIAGPEIHPVAKLTILADRVVMPNGAVWRLAVTPVPLLCRRWHPSATAFRARAEEFAVADLTRWPRYGSSGMTASFHAQATFRATSTPGEPMTDEQAIAAITRTLHDATRDRADPAWTARAIITRLRQLGWRPTAARAAPDWQHRDTPPAPPTGEYLATRPRGTP